MTTTSRQSAPTGAIRPNSHAAEELADRGLLDDATSHIQLLEIYTRSLATAFDGELDERNTSWMGYLEEKAERVERAAGGLAELASIAREMAPNPDIKAHVPPDCGR